MANGLSESQGQDKIVPLEGKLSTEDKRAKAQQYLDLLKRGVVAQSAVFLHNGFVLKTIKEERLFEFMGAFGF